MQLPPWRGTFNALGSNEASSRCRKFMDIWCRKSWDLRGNMGKSENSQILWCADFNHYVCVWFRDIVQGIWQADFVAPPDPNNGEDVGSSFVKAQQHSWIASLLQLEAFHGNQLDPLWYEVLRISIQTSAQRHPEEPCRGKFPQRSPEEPPRPCVQFRSISMVHGYDYSSYIMHLSCYICYVPISGIDTTDNW